MRTNEELNGHLGSKYQVSTVILDANLARPVAFIEPITDRDSISRRFKQFYDLSLNRAYENIDRIAIYDDAHPLPSGDALLMEEVGNLVRFVDTATRVSPWATTH